MNEDTTKSTENQADKAVREVRMIKTYIKDMSFEAPNAFENLMKGSGTDPDFSIRMVFESQEKGDDLIEVVLEINIHVAGDERNLYLIELHQAGLFQLTGIPDEEQQDIVRTECAPAIFPFVREVIWSIVGRAGFPPMLLRPLDLDSMWESLQRQSKKA